MTNSNPNKWSYNGHQYELVRASANWETARDQAKAKGGYLIEVESEEENDNLYANLKSRINFDNEADRESIANDGGGSAYVWTGGNDIDVEGVWKWDSSGESIDLNGPEWGSRDPDHQYPKKEPDDGYQGQPNPDGQDGLAIALETWPYDEHPYWEIGSPGEWNDVGTHNNLYYVIEYDPTYTLTTSASQVDEGQQLTTTVNTTNVDQGTTLYWQLSGNNITANDIEEGELEGSKTVDSQGKISFSNTLSADRNTEGDENLEIKIFSDSARSSQVGNTASVAITDTSLGPTYTLTTSSSQVDEGQVLTSTVNTTEVDPGTTLYWQLSGNNITANDLDTGELEGTAKVDGQGKASFSNTLSADRNTEGDENLEIKVFTDSARSSQVGNTASVAITDTSLDPTYTLTTSSSQVDEGQVLTSTVNTTEVDPGTTLYWQLSGNNITANDIAEGELEGSETVDSQGKISFSHTLAEDLTTEGTENLQIKLFTDPAHSMQVGNTESINIYDTSASINTPNLIVGSDSGTSDSDNITRDNTPTFSGTAKADSTVELFANGISLGNTTSDASGNWSYTVPSQIPLADGSISITTTERLRSGVRRTEIPATMPGRTKNEFRNNWRFAALKEDGSVVAWGFGGRVFGSDNNGETIDFSDIDFDGPNNDLYVSQIYSSENNFAALRSDGSVVHFGWGLSHLDIAPPNLSSGISQIFSTEEAFAALKEDGSVVTWGNKDEGGDSSDIDFDGPNDDIKVEQVYSTSNAFAALRSDGSVVTWGDRYDGGNSSDIDFDGPNNDLTVEQIYSARAAFAALRSDGSVVSWGDDFEHFEGQGSAADSSDVDFDGPNDDLTIEKIYSSRDAFAALRSDGSIVTWGHRDHTYGPYVWGERSQTGGIKQIPVSNHLGSIDLNGPNDNKIPEVYGTSGGFLAVKDDGTIVHWGKTPDAYFFIDNALDGDGNDFDGPNDDLTISKIYQGQRIAAAVRSDGSVISWGWFYESESSKDVDFDGPNNDLTVEHIYSNPDAFAAVRSDGSVVTWGNRDKGGDSSYVANDLSSGVSQIFSTDGAFAALKDDGSVVTWGSPSRGGDSSTVADDLSSGVVSFADPFHDDRLIIASNKPSDPSDPLSLVIDTIAPVIYSSNTATPIEENSGANQIIYLASTEDASHVSYSLNQETNDDIDLFSIDTSTGKVTLNEDPDYESKPSYSFTISASDVAGNISEKTISLSINDIYKNYILSTSSLLLPEGESLTTNINTADVAQGTKLYWQLSGNNITANDLDAGELEGTAEIDSQGQARFSHTLAADRTTEGNEDLQIKIFTDSARSSQVGNTASVAINDTSLDPTYTLTTSASQVDEGQHLTSTIKTTEVDPGTTLYWQLSGNNITANDLDAGELEGTAEIDSQGQARFSHTLAADRTTEGNEDLQIKIFTDSARSSQVGNTASVAINDTSLDPTYTLTTSASQVDEGQVLTSTISTTEVDPGTTLYWQLSGNNITANDLDAGELEGTAEIDSLGQARFSHTLAADRTTEGNEDLQIKIFTDSARSSQVGNTASVAINDTSLDPTYTLTTSASQVDEGQVLTSTISTTEVDPGTTLYWQLSGNNITANDLDAGELEGTAEIDSLGQARFSHTLAADRTTEGNEDLQIKIFTDSARSSQVGNTASVAINDTSLDPTYTLTTSASQVDEGQHLTSTIKTTEVDPGTTLYWQLSGNNITANDLDAGELEGSAEIDSLGQARFSHTLAADRNTEGEENIEIRIFTEKPEPGAVGGPGPTAISLVNSRVYPSNSTIIFANGVDQISDFAVNDKENINGDRQFTELNEATNLDNLASGDYMLYGNYYDSHLTFTIENKSLAIDVLYFQHTGGSLNSPASWGTGPVVWVRGASDSNRAVNFSYDFATSAPVGNTASVAINDTSLDPTYTLTTSASQVDEGQVLTSTISTTEVDPGTTLYWQLSGNNITANDLDAGELEGTAEIDSLGQARFSHTLAADRTTEGNEDLQIKIFTDSARSSQVDNTASVSITDTSLDPTYTLSTTANQVDEGQVLTSTISTTEVDPGTTLYWQLSGNNITANDLDSGELEGTAQVDGQGKASFSNTLVADRNTEGDENLEIKIFTDSARSSQVGNTASVSIGDTSLDPTYTLTTSASQVDEGQVLTSTISTTEVDPGTTLYWQLSGNNITANDLDAGELEGSAQVDSQGKATFSHTLAADRTTEGNEDLQVRLFTDPTRSTQVGETASVAINDTSLTPIYNLTTSASQVDEGDVLTTTVSTTYVEEGTELHWSLTGDNINQEDLAEGQLQGSGQVDSEGKFSFTHTIAKDAKTEGDETLGIKLYKDSARNQPVAGTTWGGVVADVLIRDSSQPPSYELTTSTNSIEEGQVLTTNVRTDFVEPGTELHWSISGVGINESDFKEGELSGSGQTDADGKFSFSHTLRNDQTREGPETLEVKLFTDALRTEQVVGNIDTNPTISINSLESLPGIYDIVRAGNASYSIGWADPITTATINLSAEVDLASISDSTNILIAEATYVNQAALQVAFRDKVIADQAWDKQDAGLIAYGDGTSSHLAVISTGGIANDAKFHDAWITNYYTGEGISDPETLISNFGSYFNHTASVEIKDTSMSTHYVRRGESAYLVVDGPSWQEAEANAVNLGGNLVTINDAAENQWLHQAFQIEPKPDSIANPLTEPTWLYTGFNDVDSEGDWEWSSGEDVTYTNWWGSDWPAPEKGWLSNTAENYMHLGFIPPDKWNDTANNGTIQNRGGIAEISLARSNQNIANSWTPNPQATADSDLELSYSLHSINDADTQTDLKQLAVLGDSVDWQDTYRLDITAKSLADGYDLETADITINFDPYLFNEIKASDITIGGQLPIANAVRIDNDVGTIRIAAASLGDLDPGDLYGNHLADAGASIGADGAVLASIELDFNEFRLDTLTQNSNGKILDPSTPLFFGLSANQDETVFSKALDDGSGWANREIKSLHDLGGDLAVDGTKVTLYEATINLEEQGDGLILSTERVIGSYNPISTNLVRSGATISTTSTWTNVGNIEAQNIQVTGITNSNAELVESESYFAYQGIGANGDQLTRNSLNSGSFSSDTGEFESAAQESGELHAAIKITGAAGNVVDLGLGIASLQADGSDLFSNQKGSKNLITFQGDLNYDGRVSMKDLAYLNAGAARQQQASEHPDEVDANSDGVVDASVATAVDANFDGQISMADLAVLDADWGQSLHQQPINGANGTQSSFNGSDDISWQELDSQGTTGDAAWDNQAFKDQNAVEASNDFVQSLESPTAVGVIGMNGNTINNDVPEGGKGDSQDESLTL